MSLGTSNRDGGKTSESGHLRALAKMVNGDIIAGLAVSQRGAGANMTVDVSIGDAFVRRSDGTYAHPVFNDAVYNQAITTADPSNPRRDIIVIYVDYGQSPSTAVSNNTNGVVKIKVVNGTPAGSPTDPSGATIQASVGSGNPYSILARVRVGAGVTSIANSVIDDLRTVITSLSNSVPTSAIQDASVTASKIEAQQAWQTMTPTSGSVTTTLGYYKDSLGIVHIRGQLNISGTPNFFTLPVGYRPEQYKEFITSSAGGAGVMSITSAGVMAKIVGANGNLDLDMITFRAA